MRRGSVVQLVAIGVAVGAVAALVAVLIPWLPPQASRERGRIDFVFWFVTVVSIAIFSLVAAVILYAVVKFRARPDDDSDGPPIHGHTGLEIAWTAVPTMLVAAIAIVSAIVLSKNGNAGTAPLRVEVTALQFTFRFSYPQLGNISSADLRLPLGRKVKFNLHSPDVIHGFWVPEFGQKQDAVPGITTHIVVTPDRVGTFPVICTQLCGLGHAAMRVRAIVMPAGQFDAWAKGQQQALAASKKGAK